MKQILAVFGQINSGKSTLVNSLAREDISIVSDVKGSTSDSVFKMTEIQGVGKVQLVDTAGYDDEGLLADKRLEKVEQAFEFCDVAIIVCGVNKSELDNAWIEKCKIFNKKYIICHNIVGVKEFSFRDEEIWLDATNLSHMDKLVCKLQELLSTSKVSLLAGLVKAEDVVLLCMPQDEESPEDRLILPQSAVIKEIVQNNGVAIACNIENFAKNFDRYKNDVSLVVTDSSVFDKVYNVVGDSINLTSFSVLFAKRNGNVGVFAAGANSINQLKDKDKVLIMEACSHTLSHKDIGRVVIPAMLKKYTGKKLIFNFCRGKDEPSDYAEYKLVVHCGGCMQNREFMMSRVAKCVSKDVKITNYGILIAKINGILDKIVY